ncbi:MAG: ParB/RepB/Spo0J family partition protein [Defluviitaleaceae bacterium]|nr:ParB/RepB/Spo0J family partition protein [Defluviitaleaceae bacterium]
MKSGLGKGLGALINSVQTAAANDTASNGVLMVDIRKVEPNPTQPRQYFNEDALDELAESMKAFGIVQPLLVTEEENRFIIIAGERRYRAARKAQLTEIPVIIKDYTEMEILQVALIENIQRQDLTSIEEAACYKRLMDDFFFSPDEVASKLGKRKHTVLNTLHLLELTPRAQELAAEGKLTASHAKVLIGVTDEALQAVCAEKIAETGLSVREAESMVTAALKAAAKKQAPPTEQADENAALALRKAENELKHTLGSKVQIIQGAKKSKIEIEFYSGEDLERLLGLFRKLQ